MHKETILKPMSVARDDFVRDLTELINTCMLPPFVIEDVLKDTCKKISYVAKAQLERDTAEYQEAIKKQEANRKKTTPK